MTPILSSPELEKEVRRLARETHAAVAEVDIDIALPNDMTGDAYPDFEARGFPFPEPGVAALMLVRGNAENRERAAGLLINSADQLREATGIVIGVQTTNEVWCRKSEPVEVSQRMRGKPIKFQRFKSRIEESRGLTFLCVSSQDHEHQWDKLKPTGDLL